MSTAPPDQVAARRAERFAPSEALAFYATLALGSGWLGVGILAYRRYVQHSFTWSGPDAAWMTPLSYLVLYGVVFLPGIVFWRLRPRHRHPTLVTGLLVGVTTFSVLTVIFGDGLHVVARLLLSIGLAIQGSRLVSAYSAGIRRHIRWVAGVLLAAVAVAAVLAFLVQPWRVRQRLAATPAPAAGAPNVLILILDTVRASALSLYGYQRPTTPMLEAWAARGVVFDSAFAPAPWTLPSHGTLFTGEPHRALSVSWLKPLDETQPVLAEAFAAAGYRTAGISANFFYVTEETGLARGFDHFVDHPRTVRQLLLSSVPGQMVAGRIFGRYEKEREADEMDANVVQTRLRRWIALPSDRPWFGFLNFFDAHKPYFLPVTGHPDFGGSRTERDRYDIAIWSIDREIGALLRELESQRILEHTLVIITADHGEHFGEHGLHGHAQSLYTPLLHVPLMVLGPGVPGGVRVRTPTSLEDVAATVQELAALPSPRFPGRSFAACWRLPACGRTTPDTVTAAVQASPERQARGPSAKGPLVAVVVDRWHYIRNAQGREELYDLSLDPTERRNLARDSAESETLGRLRASARGAALPAATRQMGGQ